MSRNRFFIVGLLLPYSLRLFNRLYLLRILQNSLGLFFSLILRVDFLLLHLCLFCMVFFRLICGFVLLILFILCLGLYLRQRFSKYFSFGYAKKSSHPSLYSVSVRLLEFLQLLRINYPNSYSLILNHFRKFFSSPRLSPPMAFRNQLFPENFSLSVPLEHGCLHKFLNIIFSSLVIPSNAKSVSFLVF